MKDINIIISEASPDEAYEINMVYYKTWLSTYPNEKVGVTVDDIEDSYKDEFTTEKIDNLKKIIENKKSDTKRLVAKIGEKIVGVCTVVAREDYNHLRTLYVLPEYQGMGVGIALWNEGKKIFNKDKDVIVQVADYTQAISFYKKLGFVDTGVRTSEETGKMKSGALIVDMEMKLDKSLL